MRQPQPYLRRLRTTGMFALLALLFGFLAKPASASHIAGAEITYECLGNNTYAVTLSTYRDCSGIFAPTQYTLSAQDTCGGANITFTANQVSSVEVSQICSSQLGSTTCNGGILPGVELITYTGTVTLNSTCALWNFSWNLCCMNTSLNVVGSPSLFVRTSVLNPQTNCNSSPVSQTVHPTPFFCLNSPQTYSFAALDPNADSLVYSLIPGLSSLTNAYGYSTGFSGTMPIPGASLDPNSGLLTFSPTVLGNYVITIQIEEYDANGVLIGTTMRTTQFYVLNCTNHQPTTNGQITNFSGSAVANGNLISLCPGDSFCFDITFSDSNLSDTLTALSNVTTALPGATITTSGTNPMTATICWVATGAVSGFQPFSVTASDGVCPVPGATTVGFGVLVNGISAGPDVTICPGGSATLNASGGSGYTWTVVSGDPITTANFSCTNCASPSASPTITTTYALSGTSGCGSTDTVTVTVLPAPTMTLSANTSICQGSWATLVATGGGTYLWSTGNTNDTIYAQQAGWYHVTVTDSSGCSVSDSVMVTVNPNPTATITGNSQFCPGTSTVLTASGGTTYLWSTGATTSSVTVVAAGTYTVTVVDANGCSATASQTVGTYFVTPATISGNNWFCAVGTTTLTANPTGTGYAWSNGSIAQSINVGTAGTYAVTVTDSNGCMSSASMVVTMSTATATIVPDTITICPGDTANLMASGGGSYIWSNGDTGSTTIALMAGTYTVTVTNGYGCTATDQVVVVINTNLYVAGTLTTSGGSPLANTTVYLIKHFVGPDSVVALQTVTTNSQGQYVFVTSEPLVYVKGAPDSTSYPGEIPTYYDSSATFTGATGIVPTCDTTWINFSTIAGTNPGGPGFISGYVWAGAGKSDCPTDPEVNLSLILVDANDIIVAYVETDQNGYFMFPNLPDGDYTIWADEPGIDNQLGPMVTVGSGSDSEDLDFSLTANQLEPCGTVGIDEVILKDLRVFPNPGDGLFQLEAGVESNGKFVSVQVINALGQAVLSQNMTLTGRQQVDLTNMAPGIYFLRVQLDDDQRTFRVIKK